MNSFNNWSIINNLLIKQSQIQQLWIHLDFSNLVNEVNEYVKILVSELQKKKDNLNY